MSVDVIRQHMPNKLKSGYMVRVGDMSKNIIILLNISVDKKKILIVFTLHALILYRKYFLKYLLRECNSSASDFLTRLFSSPPVFN